MLDRCFTENAVRNMATMIPNTVDRNLDQLISKQGSHTTELVDLVHGFAGLVPTEMIYRILGVPDEDISTLVNDSEARTSTVVLLRNHPMTICGKKCPEWLTSASTSRKWI